MIFSYWKYIAIILSLIVLIYHEWSWYRAYDNLMIEIKILTSEKQKYLDTLQCPTNLQEPSKLLSNTYYSMINHRKIYDRYGIGWCILLISCMFYEITFSHSEYLQHFELEVEKGIISRDCVNKLRIFLTIKLLYTNLILFSIILVGSCLAWLGFFSQPKYNEWTLKLMILWSTSIPISFYLHNLYRILPYLPSTFEKWNDKLQSDGGLFLLWMGNKILALDDFQYFTQTYITIIISWIFIWPYRYYFYYYDISFQYSNNILPSRIVDKFILHMIMHISVAWLWTHIIPLFLIYSPQMILASTWMRRVNMDQIMVILTVIYALSTIVCLIRILWFLFISWGWKTWYSFFIVLSSILIHIIIVAFGVLSLNIYSLRSKLIRKNKKDFIAKYTLKAIESENEVMDESDSIPNPETKTKSQPESKPEPKIISDEDKTTTSSTTTTTLPTESTTDFSPLGPVDDGKQDDITVKEKETEENKATSASKISNENDHDKRIKLMEQYRYEAEKMFDYIMECTTISVLFDLQSDPETTNDQSESKNETKSNTNDDSNDSVDADEAAYNTVKQKYDQVVYNVATALMKENE